MENRQRNDLESLILSILPEPSRFDFIVTPRGNVFAVRPVSLVGQRYADQFLPRLDTSWPDQSLAIQAHELIDVVRGMHDAGLSVGGAS